MGKGMMRIRFSYFLSGPVPDLTCAFYFSGCEICFLVARYAGQKLG